MQWIEIDSTQVTVCTKVKCVGLYNLLYMNATYSHFYYYTLIHSLKLFSIHLDSFTLYTTVTALSRLITASYMYTLVTMTEASCSNAYFIRSGRFKLHWTINSEADDDLDISGLNISPVHANKHHPCESLHHHRHKWKRLHTLRFLSPC